MNSLWCAEFRGFFYADGYLGVVGNGTRRGRPYHVAVAQITLRADDRQVLVDIQAQLGGVLYDYVRKGDGVQFTVWRTRNREELTVVCDILARRVLPAKKRDQVGLVREFLAMRAKWGELDDDMINRRIELVSRIKQAHAYSAPSVEVAIP